MSRVRNLLFVVALCAVCTLPIKVSAQSDSAISYGQTIKGEITDSQASINYTFKAGANDVVVITMRQDGSDSSVSPHLLLLDSNQQTIADSKDQVAIYSVNLAAQLTDAGQYTITAASADDKSTGKFQVSLAKANALKPNTAVKGSTSSDTFAYYSYTSSSPFSLTYEKQGGDFSPTVSVNSLDNNEMKAVGVIGGKEVSNGTLGINPTENGLYIVSIGEGTLDFNIEKVSVNYSLKVTAGQ